MSHSIAIKAAAWDLDWTPGTRLREFTIEDLQAIARRAGSDITVATVARTLCPGESLKDLVQ